MACSGVNSPLTCILLDFNIGMLGGTTNVQTAFDLCPRVLKHVVGYRGRRVPCAGLQLPKIAVFDLVDEVGITLTTRCLADGSVEKRQLLGLHIAEQHFVLL